MLCFPHLHWEQQQGEPGKKVARAVSYLQGCVAQAQQKGFCHNSVSQAHQERLPSLLPFGRLLAAAVHNTVSLTHVSGRWG
jgi:hypothetical protein